MKFLNGLFSLLLVAVFGSSAHAEEFYIGGPVVKNDMEIVANYLKSIDMDPAFPMDMKGEMIHLEADVHATADNKYGYADGQWIPYLTITYVLEKEGSPWKTTGQLAPMIAKDGTHYANNISVDGAGKYKLTYHFEAPQRQGFLRHTDKETGVPAWWAPFSVEFPFTYPVKAK